VTVRAEAVKLETEGVMPAHVYPTLQVAVICICNNGGMVFVRVKRSERNLLQYRFVRIDFDVVRPF
jgi:hypothetical protein